MAKVARNTFHDAVSQSATSSSWEVSYCPTVAIEAAPVGFSGSITIQGSLYSDHWQSVLWVRQGVGGVLLPSVLPISLVQENTRSYYRVLGLWAWVRVVVERTAGSVTVMGLATDAFVEMIHDLDDSGQVPTKEVHRNLVFYEATGATAIAVSVAPSGNFKVVAMTCHLSAAPNGSNAFTLSLDRIAGSAYDYPIYAVTPPATAAGQDIGWGASDDISIGRFGDAVQVAFANAGGATWGLCLVWELL